MILALVFVIRNFVSRSSRPETARGWLLIYLLLAFAATVFFLPIWNGSWLPYDLWRWRMWLPSWI
jgi:dolichyl-phosphate-mannose--protein O-mannosyl transferase